MKELKSFLQISLTCDVSLSTLWNTSNYWRDFFYFSGINPQKQKKIFLIIWWDYIYFKEKYGRLHLSYILCITSKCLPSGIKFPPPPQGTLENIEDRGGAEWSPFLGMGCLCQFVPIFVLCFYSCIILLYSVFLSMNCPESREIRQGQHLINKK